MRPFPLDSNNDSFILQPEVAPWECAGGLGGLFCYWHPDQRLPTQRLKLLQTNTQGSRCGHYWVHLHISTGKWSKKTFGSKFNVPMHISQRVAINTPVSDLQHPGLLKTFTARLISANRFFRNHQIWFSYTPLRRNCVITWSPICALYI